MALFVAALAVFSLVLHVDGLTDAEIAKFTSLGCGVRYGTCSGKFMYGEVSLTKNTAKDTITVVANGIPDHPTCNNTMLDAGETCYNDPLTSWLEEQNHNQEIPLNPELAGTTTGLPNGEVGYAINGVSILSPYSKTCSDAVEDELIGFDNCMGHPQEIGDYHYHAAPICLNGYMEAHESQSQFLVGVAWDGFPIYNEFNANGEQIDNSVLDACHGYDPADGTGYRYIVNDHFPYIIGCFRGTPLTSVSEACGTSRRRLSAEKIERMDAEVQRVRAASRYRYQQASQRRRLQPGGNTGGSGPGGNSGPGDSGGSSTQEARCGEACSECGENANVALCGFDTPSPSTLREPSPMPTEDPSHGPDTPTEDPETPALSPSSEPQSPVPAPTIQPTNASPQPTTPNLSNPTAMPTTNETDATAPSSATSTPTTSPTTTLPVDNSNAATALRGILIVAGAVLFCFC